MGKGPSKIDSYIEIINNTYQDITNTRCYDNFSDFNDVTVQWRLYHTLQNLRISARGGRIERKEDSEISPCALPFSIALTFADGSVDEFNIGGNRLLGHEKFTHFKGSHHITCCRSGKEKLIIKVENTSQQIVNHRAEEKNKEGEAALKQNQFETAIKKFDEALESAIQSTAINVIKKNKSRACGEFGNQLLSQGWDLEGDVTNDRSQEAQSKFDQARNLFQEAQNLSSSSEYQQNLNLVNLKIEENRLFNEANELEKQAFKLFETEKGDNTNAQNNYKESLQKYEEAVQQFEEGAKIESKFCDSVEVTNELIQEIKKVIDDIDRHELNYNISKVNVDEEKKDKSENEQVFDTKSQEQVEVVTS